MGDSEVPGTILFIEDLDSVALGLRFELSSLHKPAESEGDGAVNGLVNEVFHWTLGGWTSNVQWKQGDAIWEQDTSRSKGAPAIPPTREEHEKTLYDELVLLDNKLGSC
ncbi:hypothetical protein PILCRDRAFT_6989 [Piloderma croceum F 1598]|uniref:Uncharacterized protein n=1 Tax=Piloderma croceum (strain F 1598) TaxID=765440 RepID=A0A0C3FGU8_PILCF|nr:hypothetical protein PILCRDRAFT_6989 [Piloderma croceum F 1598]